MDASGRDIPERGSANRAYRRWLGVLIMRYFFYAFFAALGLLMAPVVFVLLIVFFLAVVLA
jgi:hypothetical protein